MLAVVKNIFRKALTKSVFLQRFKREFCFNENSVGRVMLCFATLELSTLKKSV